MNRILLFLSVFFILLGCKNSATGPAPVTYPIYVKAGSYTGTYTENRKTYTISINIYKDSDSAWHIDIASPDSAQLEYYGLDTKDDSSIATVTSSGDLGYTIDFENMKATSMGGTDNGYIYKLVKIATT